MRSCWLACCLSSVFLLVSFQTILCAREPIVIAPNDSIEQAIGKSRDVRGQQPETVTIQFRGGVFWLDQPIVLTPADCRTR